MRYEVRNNYIKAITNLEVGSLLFQFLRNNSMLTSENISNKRFITERARVSTSSFTGNISYYQSAFRSMSTHIMKMIIPQNTCIKVTCTCSHKTAVVATIQIYSSTKFPQADCVVRAVKGVVVNLNCCQFIFHILLGQIYTQTKIVTSRQSTHTHRKLK